MHKTYIRFKRKHVRQMSEKLRSCLTAPKTYWKILNRFLNNLKIPSIPPLLVNGKVVSNFLGKQNFATNSLPLSVSVLRLPVHYLFLVKMILPRSSKN